MGKETDVDEDGGVISTAVSSESPSIGVKFESTGLDISGPSFPSSVDAMAGNKSTGKLLQTS
jgi:hypothetical protein